MAIEKGIPSQLDPEDLAAEVELEVPGSMEPIAMVDMDVEAENMDIEITAEDDGGVTIDFEPTDQRGMSGAFYATLAGEMPSRELGRIAGEL